MSQSGSASSQTPDFSPSRRLAADMLCAYASPKYLAHRGTPLHPYELADTIASACAFRTRDRRCAGSSGSMGGPSRSRRSARSVSTPATAWPPCLLREEESACRPATSPRPMSLVGSWCRSSHLFAGTCCRHRVMAGKPACQSEREGIHRLFWRSLSLAGALGNQLTAEHHAGDATR
jgi:hypothetical protein